MLTNRTQELNALKVKHLKKASKHRRVQSVLVCSTLAFNAKTLTAFPVKVLDRRKSMTLWKSLRSQLNKMLRDLHVCWLIFPHLTLLKICMLVIWGPQFKEIPYVVFSSSSAMKCTALITSVIGALNSVCSLLRWTILSQTSWMKNQKSKIYKFSIKKLKNASMLRRTSRNALVKTLSSYSLVMTIALRLGRCSVNYLATNSRSSTTVLISDLKRLVNLFTTLCSGVL